MSAEWYLGVETSTKEGSLALFNKAEAHSFHEFSWTQTHSHSEVITLFSQKLFEKVGIHPSILSGLVCGCGPGSFTGIRVAMNFAKSLAYANDLPIWTVNTLENLASQVSCKPGEHIFSSCEAFRDLIYIARYTNEGSGSAPTETLAPQAVTANQLCYIITTPSLVIGRGFHLYWEELKPIHHLLTMASTAVPTAQSAIQSTVGLSTPPSPKDWKTAKPLYIRASEAEEKLKSGELKPQKLRF